MLTKASKLVNEKSRPRTQVETLKETMKDHDVAPYGLSFMTAGPDGSPPPPLGSTRPGCDAFPRQKII